MAHHASEHLTSPLDDSESYFFTSDTWAGFGRIKRAFWTVHNTLLGRLLLGPVAVLGRVYPGELAKIVRGDLSHIRYWTGHALVVAAILSWCHFVCNIAVWEYMLYFVYPGMALGLLRSFAEHTPGDTQEERIAVVETNPILGLLFLNNNLHILHHTRPGLPWYQYRARYEQEREALLKANGGLLYRGYRELFRRFSFRAIASPAHPMERVQ